MDKTLRCKHCEDVIGAYEPMVVLSEGRARRTSRSVERAAGGPLGECYHDACYAQAHAEDPPP